MQPEVMPRRVQDSRQLERYDPLSGVYVVLNSSPEQIGLLVNINMQGLACLGVGFDRPGFCCTEASLNVIHQGFLLDHIPVQVAYLYPLAPSTGLNRASVCMIGFRFGPLSLYHRHNIEGFLDDFTSGRGPDVGVETEMGLRRWIAAT